MNGQASVPGDKSVSHRSLMLSALAVGRSEVRGLLEGEDVLATAAAMRAFGATVNRLDAGHYEVYGIGVGGLMPPSAVIEMGNSGTSTRLLMGLIASHNITVRLAGDASLSGRPMGRVITPLEQVGAVVEACEGKYLPLTITGTADPMPLDYTPPMASAQVKSAVMLAGLNTPGHTIVREKTPTRDHTERMLSAMGADVRVVNEDGYRVVTLVGQPELNPINIHVPGDISSAAFLLAAATMVPGSNVKLLGVGINPLRTGIVGALRAMRANISIENERMLGGEPVADIHVVYSPLQSVSEIPIEPSTMIDEFPVLFCAAATAVGSSAFTGLSELRVKESDRIAVMAKGLLANGVHVEELPDGLVVHGQGGLVPGGSTVQTHLDHRIAMSFAVLGQMAETPITIDDASPIQTSFPNFIELMISLGAGLSLG
ncbi:3-phosphoshikimate 1-carboxyvinyltransferase [Kordiimonas aquimaris]|uniref:3-phosphoshikimate 1-carboxyvinyltransferase n=1 Tax=Kordiimonas aquimaris TaxID=707591 RepID=UPI00374D165F